MFALGITLGFALRGLWGSFAPDTRGVVQVPPPPVLPPAPPTPAPRQTRKVRRLLNDLGVAVTNMGVRPKNDKRRYAPSGR